jgi:hypothetical protein
MGQGEETHEMTDEAPQDLLGSFIRAQRQLANLSLRQLSALTEVSNWPSPDKPDNHHAAS